MIEVNILICGSNHPVSTTDAYAASSASDVFEKILDLNEYDDVYATEGQYIFNLEDLFTTEEDTTWRDEIGFLDSISSVCRKYDIHPC